MSQSLLQSAVLRRDIQHIRRQFSNCFAQISTLSVDKLSSDDGLVDSDCELCLCVGLLLHHCTQCSRHWKHCDQCFQLATIIKTHIQVSALSINTYYFMTIYE